ncbi:Com family DNA-binding transcriptional regulator [Clostridium butyricum]|nr:Com family DNA-binding transcriptional regulator [Clostridium butyricum]MCQ2016806.1 Com family DNA-binding transcriptional regulator [Clostridium butyricum]MCQ2022587.1 Com family DNA-binding transcriptional regulator [Clostridium butyricum]MDU3581160.1 Com family DNA-binding transcriptional regulator [Clostridium butyricum]MDU3594722.1 Com family DNA-binding transcriptional regulator [Clostridium butyricum]NFB69541.1 Com family DNA-binding transcriptional regulator [Clostridium butyricum]
MKIKDIRCINCNQLLLKADEVKGEIKCPRCKQINKLDYSKDRA